MEAIGTIEMKTSRQIIQRNGESASGIAEDALMRRYGPLVNLLQLASILDRSPQGLRVTLCSSREWVAKIYAARLRLGRRVCFRTAEIAEMLGIR